MCAASSALDGVLVTIVLFCIKDLPTAGWEDVLVPFIPVALHHLHKPAQPGTVGRCSARPGLPGMYPLCQLAYTPSHQPCKPRAAWGNVMLMLCQRCSIRGDIQHNCTQGCAHPKQPYRCRTSSSKGCCILRRRVIFAAAYLSRVHVLALHGCVIHEPDVVPHTKVKQRARLATRLVDDQLVEAVVVRQNQVFLQFKRQLEVSERLHHEQ